MPVEAPAAPPPAAPAAPSPAPAPTPELHVTTASVIDHGPPPEPPKKGSAREAMMGELRKKAGVEEAPAKPKPETEPEPEPEPIEGQEPPAPDPGKAAEPVKKGKISPWKLVDEHKAARAKAEQELAELRKAVPDPVKSKEIEEKLSTMEKRAKELEEEIRFTNYEKSEEYREKYQKPYEDAWKRWMNDLRELTVSTPEGQERPIEPMDLLQLVRMPLKEARAAAEEIFGNFADDVMDARKEINNLFDAQNRAKEEARKGGAERDAQRTKQMKEMQEALSQEITRAWKEANESVLNDEKIAHIFKPVDGDDEGNKRLAKGYEMADKAFAVSPLNPNLTAQERADIVKLHAAVRNRAAAFGRLSFQNSKLSAQLKELTAELAKFKSAEPGAGEGARGERPAGPASARDQVFGALRKIAH